MAASSLLSSPLIITDNYGNVVTHQFSQVAIPDSVAPVIMIDHKTYSIRVGTEIEVARAELLGNFAAMDDSGGEVILDVVILTDLTSIGVYAVEYRATDESGNTASEFGYLRVTSEREPILSYNGRKILRDGGLAVSEGSDITVDVDSFGSEYKVILADGIKTVAQIKTAGETVQGYGDGDQIVLAGLKEGVYTVVILTQDRDYFIFYITVMEE